MLDAYRRALAVAPTGRLLEPERPRLVRSAGHGVEVGIEQLAVDHRVADAGRIMDVVERVLVENHEVGELARFDGAEIMIESMRSGRIDRRGLERFHVAHATQCETPHLPVCAKPFA